MVQEEVTAEDKKIQDKKRKIQVQSRLEYYDHHDDSSDGMIDEDDMIDSEQGGPVSPKYIKLSKDPGGYQFSSYHKSARVAHLDQIVPARRSRAAQA